MDKVLSFGTKKIRKSGIYTQSLSLPKVWLQNAGLNIGDNVLVEMAADGSLTIRPAKKK